MVRLIERGVGGMVTNAPDELVRIRRERAELTDRRAAPAGGALPARARIARASPDRVLEGPASPGPPRT